MAPSGGPRDTTVCTIAQEGFARFVSLSLELTRVRAGTRPGGPPQRSVVRGRGGRRPSHGVAGTTPVSHGGRLFVACPRTQGAGRGSHSAILGQPHCRGPAEYGHIGGNLYERHRRHVPLGVPRDDPLRDGRAYLSDGPEHQKRARPPHGPQGKDMAPTQPHLSCHLSGGSVPLYKSPHHTVDATSCTRSCRAGTHSPICLNNFPICVMYARGGRDNGTQGAGTRGSRCMSRRFQLPKPEYSALSHPASGQAGSAGNRGPPRQGCTGA